MRKLVLFATMTMLIQLGAYGQEIGISVGYASFSMSELKEFNQEIMEDMDLPAGITDDFPGYLNAEISFNYPFSDRYVTGVYVSYTSTGSRIAYNDYSGHQYIDQQLQGLGFGIQAALPFQADSPNGLGIKVKAGMITTFQTIISEFAVYSNSSSESIKFRSNNFSLEPALYYKHQIKTWPVSVLVEAGYAANVIKGELFLKGDSNAYLTNQDGDPVRADWSGVRISLGVTYNFSLR